MTTTRHIIDITANLVPGFEAEETSEAKNIAYEILEYDHIPDSGDAITAADRVVEALIKAGWRPTVEEPAAEHMEGEQAAPTDAEIQAAAEGINDYEGGVDGGVSLAWDDLSALLQQHYLGTARAALVAAREVTRHE